MALNTDSTLHLRTVKLLPSSSASLCQEQEGIMTPNPSFLQDSSSVGKICVSVCLSVQLGHSSEVTPLPVTVTWAGLLGNYRASSNCSSHPALRNTTAPPSFSSAPSPPQLQEGADTLRRSRTGARPAEEGILQGVEKGNRRHRNIQRKSCKSNTIYFIPLWSHALPLVYSLNSPHW